MELRSSILFGGLFMLAILIFNLSTGSVNAQSASPLRTHPSEPAAPGMSPLEPYLIIWLLPVSGVLTALAGVFVSQGMLKRNARSMR